MTPTESLPGMDPLPLSMQPAAATRVLLIEDNRGFAYFIRDVFRRQVPGRFELAETGTLAEGLEILGRGGVDVVLLDLGLPDSVRIETFARVSAQAPGVATIVLTVLNDDEVAMQALRLGAEDYLVKDQVDSNLLIRCIRYAVERARTKQALHRLSSRLVDAQDAERRKIARHLDDTTAQNLAALSMNLSLLQSAVAGKDPRLERLVVEALSFAEASSKEVRTLSYLLHPPFLEELGLAGAVRDYADGFAVRSGIRVDLEVDTDIGRLPRDIETALFLVMQECLTNIHRHSGSRTASIRLNRSPTGATMDVRDAGRGMPRQDTQDGAGAGVGLAGMRERIRQFGGQLAIRTGDTGTRVVATLRLRGGV